MYTPIPPKLPPESDSLRPRISRGDKYTVYGSRTELRRRGHSPASRGRCTSRRPSARPASAAQEPAWGPGSGSALPGRRSPRPSPRAAGGGHRRGGVSPPHAAARVAERVNRVHVAKRIQRGRRPPGCGEPCFSTARSTTPALRLATTSARSPAASRKIVSLPRSSLGCPGAGWDRMTARSSRHCRRFRLPRSTPCRCTSCPRRSS